jgi:hypothetical protein
MSNFIAETDYSVILLTGECSGTNLHKVCLYNTANIVVLERQTQKLGHNFIYIRLYSVQNVYVRPYYFRTFVYLAIRRNGEFGPISLARGSSVVALGFRTQVRSSTRVWAGAGAPSHLVSSATSLGVSHDGRGRWRRRGLRERPTMEKRRLKGDWIRTRAVARERGPTPDYVPRCRRTRSSKDVKRCPCR